MRETIPRVDGSTAPCGTAASEPKSLDPATPASLRERLGAALALLGLPDDEPPPTRSGGPRRPVAVTWSGGTYHRRGKPRGERAVTRFVDHPRAEADRLA
ncbi:hypothetical protein COO58_16370 [Micromonospora sp. WMMA1996]|nr:hypothetical protein COO58_16370 [Micromonospora sp. WMMA1996]